MHFPSLLRRSGAMLYDSFLLFSICLMGSVAALFITHGEAIPPGTLVFQLYLLGLCYAFLIWFWSHGGQTAGMAAWRLRLVNYDHQPVGWRQATLRFLLAIPFIALGGIGWLWTLADKEKQTLYDRFAKTKVILLPKPAKKKKKKAC